MKSKTVNEKVRSPKKTMTMNFRIDEELKQRSKIVITRYGLDHSKALRLFFEYIVEQNDIPDWMKQHLKVE